ncbi:MAG: bifunctional hydroxymethylpyrimidine kinase/phosphomethylpyrimidine kinase [Bacteroidaceae bacterium]|nr:bifunctional hydroxymethylpyrimidine kinase/phosphomethylpyrimidine kinase [Bacteroidaceae bacterium]
MQKPIILTIAGSDPSGGAGLQADLRVIQALGCYGMGAVTALTAQTTRGVSEVWPLSREQVANQLIPLIADVRPDAIKVGMLGDESAALGVLDALQCYGKGNIVVDTVLLSSSGAELLDPAAIDVLKEVMRQARVVTPNLPEAEALLGRKLEPAVMAREISLLCNGASVYLKGGHSDADQLTDFLYDAEQDRLQEMSHLRVSTCNTHGTGCVLSSALASYLAKGFSLPEAAQQAHVFIAEALAAGRDVCLGHGHGPSFY